jgi:hypothetical protein
MEVNAQYVWEYFAPLGWTKNAVAAMLGNMQTESTINPAIWEGLDEDDTDGGYGIVQWTPATKFLNWCNDRHLNPTHMDSNLWRIIYEVENDIQWGNDSDGNPPPFSFEEFTHSELDPYDLAMYFLWHYERPADNTQPNRGVQAEYWFTFLKGVKKKKGFKPYLIRKKVRYII